MSTQTLAFERIEEHYALPGLEAAIRGALVRQGKHPEDATQDDLNPIDEYHFRGHEATVELAERLSALGGLGPGVRVLDVGSGLGGAARYLASAYGCQVTGIDLTDEYVRLAKIMAGWIGLDGQVSFQHGNALAMPFDDASFDVVWTQHAAMNIPDKPRLYAEMRRVLRPGGRLALYDILAGPGGPAYFPVPWASEPGLSFLIAPEALDELLAGSGFQVLSRRDTSQVGLERFRGLIDRIRQANGAGGPGIHLLSGDKWDEVAQNVIRNAEEKRIVVLEVIAERL